MCSFTVEQLQKVIALEGEAIKPMFGICMGNQLMGLAAGCTASKLPFGNRGQNQVIRCSLVGLPYLPQLRAFAKFTKEEALALRW